MSEATIIKKTGIVTKEQIKADLRHLGLKENMTLILHSSLSKVGWVCGGQHAVITAIQEIITGNGTLVMPAFCRYNSDPAKWDNPPVPPEWHQIIAEHMPAFDINNSETTNMGVIAESFRKYRGVFRSCHPQSSFCAWGKKAEEILEDHPLDFAFAEHCPLGKLYQHDAFILLLGVDYDSCTTFHLGEYKSKIRKEIDDYFAVWEDNRRVWKRVRDYMVDTSEFNTLGALMEQQGLVTRDKIGYAESRFLKVRDAVDISYRFFKNRHS
jgi:aminoglycoside 3-N-acetyltransferase